MLISYEGYPCSECGEPSVAVKCCGAPPHGGCCCCRDECEGGHEPLCDDCWHEAVVAGEISCPSGCERCIELGLQPDRRWV